MTFEVDKIYRTKGGWDAKVDAFMAERKKRMDS